jgi:hypothetical protein
LVICYSTSKDVEYLKGNQEKMDSELRRSGRIEGQESRERTRKGKERERPPSPPDLAAGKPNSGILRQKNIDQAPEQEKIKLANSSVKDECETIFQSAYKKIYALYKHLYEELGAENLAKRVGFSKRDIDPLREIYKSLHAQETITDEDLDEFLKATNSLIDKLEILENNAEEEEKSSDSLKKELEKQKKIKLNSSVKDECETIFRSAYRKMHALYKHLKEELGAENLAKRVGFSKKDIDPLTEIYKSSHAQETITDEDLEEFLKATNSLIDKLEILENNAEEEEKSSDSLKKELEKLRPRQSELSDLTSLSSSDELDLSSITISREDFAKIQNTIITNAAANLYSISSTSDINVENREKSVLLIRKARDEKGTDDGYAKYEAVLHLAQEDASIYHMMKRIYTEHSNNTDTSDIARITLTKEDFAKIQNTIITKASGSLSRTSRSSEVNVENREKAVLLIRKARDEKGTDDGYAKYEAVLQLAQEDLAIYHMVERIYTEHSNNTDISDIARITLTKEDFAKIQNTIITKASGILSSTSGTSDINVENREKAVLLIRKARDEKGTDDGYAKYEEVLQLAQEDRSIYNMVERIYTEHSNNTDTSDIARITLTKEDFAKIQNTIITKAVRKLDSISGNSDINFENRKEAARLIRKARDEKGTDEGYAKYEEVLQLAREDRSIYHMMESIYQHVVNMSERPRKRRRKHVVDMSERPRKRRRK